MERIKLHEHGSRGIVAKVYVFGWVRRMRTV
jgi:hypothetical protein